MLSMVERGKAVEMVLAAGLKCDIDVRARKVIAVHPERELQRSFKYDDKHMCVLTSVKSVIRQLV